MNRRIPRPALLAFVCFLVLSNAVILWWRYKSIQTASMTIASGEPQLKRQRERLSWEAHPVIPLDTDDLRRHVEQIKIEDCVPIPARGTRLQPTPTSETHSAQLRDCITTFLQAYRREAHSARAVLSMMQSFGMTLEPNRTKVLRELLPMRSGVSAEQAAAMTPDQVYSAFWDAASTPSSMSGIIVESSCITIWSARDTDLSRIKQTEDLTEWVPKEWEGINSVVPSFVAAPVDAPAAPGSAGRALLIADVKLIISNRGVSREGNTPYLLRWVYNNDAARWQPIALVGILLEDVEIGAMAF